MKLFGTDGIRGDSCGFPFDDRSLFVIGKSVAETLGRKKSILIIRDTRESGKRIQKALAKGIVSAGADIVFGGVMPTPAASFLLSGGEYCAAIVISASHNPYRDNGIKIFDSKGLKLTDKAEAGIEKKINKYFSGGFSEVKIRIDKKEQKSLLKSYEKFLADSFGPGTLKGKTIVIDCANGAAGTSASEVLKKLGARLIVLNDKPDGRNINKNCGALHPEKAAKTVKERKAFCGFCFDGDGDRLICIDENGAVRDGDFFLGSMAKYLKSKKKLKNNVLVTTVMANIGLVKAMEKAGVKVITAKVGDRYVLEEMKRCKASLGGEQSGHFIFRDFLSTGDGLLSAVRLLAALNEKNETMSSMFSGIGKFPQVLVNKAVKNKIPLENLPETSSMVKFYEDKLGDEGRIVVRYSGTENLLRVMVEGKRAGEIKKMAKNIISCADKEISGKNNDQTRR